MPGQPIQEFVHPDETEVRAISGGYDIEREFLLDIGGRQALCLVGTGVVDSSCCGVGGCRFAFVPGFVVEHRFRQNDAGQWVSTVEHIDDPDIRAQIRKTLEQTEMIQQINFE